MKASVTIDACRGDIRPRRLKVEHKDGKITEALTTDVLRELLKQRDLEADVRADWWAINRRCSAPGCERSIKESTAQQALRRGTKPRCLQCFRAAQRAGAKPHRKYTATWITDQVMRGRRAGLSFRQIVADLTSRRVLRGDGQPFTTSQLRLLVNA